MIPRSLLLAFLPLPALAAAIDLEIRVADELGRPVADAEVDALLVPRLSADPFNSPAQRIRVAARADERGRARLQGRHAPDHLAVTARAEGFYAVSRRVTAFDRVVRLSLLQQGPRVPSVRVDLLTSSLPADGSPLPFDLERGAFLPPVGVGRRADLLLAGRCESHRLPPGSPETFEDHAELRFLDPRSGCLPVPRPGQEGFAASVQPFLADQLLHEVSHPLEAPAEGYQPSLTYRLARTQPAPPPGDLAWVRPLPGVVPSPGRVGSPQWLFRIRPGPAALHGVITDFGWVDGGRLRLAYRISSEPGNPSLEFDAPER
ncbi:MAG: hypothetical protein ACKN9V_05585 [Pseudomonadota bacterium]